MLLFLYGEDSFRSNERLNSLKEKFFKKNTSNASSSVFDFDEDASFEKLSLALRGSGLFSSNKLIVVKNFLNSNKTEQDKLFEYLKHNEVSEDIDLVFWEEGEPRKNNKLFKFLLEKFESERFGKLSGAQLSDWIKKEFCKNKTNIDAQALNKLSSFVGDDLLQAKNEIDKLVNFVQEKTITEKDVELMVSSKVEANIFETIEAISAGNKNRALKLFHDQLSYGDDPFYIFSMYVYQFRNLLKIGSFYFGGVDSKGIDDKNIIAKETRLHPFVVQKGIYQLKNISLQKLKNIYQYLEKIDSEVKGGKIEMKNAIDKLISMI